MRLLWVVSSGILKGVGSSEDIEDCVAETFAYLWEHPEKYESQKGSIKSYLCIIVKSKAIDRMRKISRMSKLDLKAGLESEDYELEEIIVNKETVKEIYGFAKNLREPESEIFMLRYFYQLKPREIAEKLNMTVKEVANKLYYSKKNLLSQIKL